jgi:hypothetical protein
MRLAFVALAVATTGVAAPARAAVCPAEAALRADSRWRSRDCELCVINRIYVGPESELRWNGARVTPGTLRQYLGITAHMNPLPFAEFIIRPGADCEMIAHVRTWIERAVPCEPGFHCGFALVHDRTSRRPSPPPPPSRRRAR